VLSRNSRGHSEPYAKLNRERTVAHESLRQISACRLGYNKALDYKQSEAGHSLDYAEASHSLVGVLDSLGEVRCFVEEPAENRKTPEI
jgi:hypothetical protein